MPHDASLLVCCHGSAGVPAGIWQVDLSLLRLDESLSQPMLGQLPPLPLCLHRQRSSPFTAFGTPQKRCYTYLKLY